MIKAVLFDFGGVLTEGGRAGAVQENIAALCGRQPSEIVVGDLHEKFIRSQITEAEFFAELNRRYPCPTPISAKAFHASSSLYKKSLPVYKLAETLRAHGVVTGILSNIYPINAAKLQAEGYYDGFDPLVLSSVEHLAKPDPEFFKVALSKLNLPGHEVLFIEDQQRFKKVAESLGMHFLLAESPTQIVADTKALLQKQNGIRL